MEQERGSSLDTDTKGIKGTLSDLKTFYKTLVVLYITVKKK